MDTNLATLGRYYINGPLLPGENDERDITPILFEILYKKEILKVYDAKTPDTDDWGDFYFPTIHYLQKYEFKFEIHISLSFELEIEGIPNQSFDLKRIFDVNLYSDYPYGHYEPDDDDNYSTEIKMKMGEWIQSRDYFFEKTKKKIKKPPGVKGLH